MVCVVDVPIKLQAVGGGGGGGHPQVLGKFVCIKHDASGCCSMDACITNATIVSQHALRDL